MRKINRKKDISVNAVSIMLTINDVLPVAKNQDVDIIVIMNNGRVSTYTPNGEVIDTNLDPDSIPNGIVDEYDRILYCRGVACNLYIKDKLMMVMSI